MLAAGGGRRFGGRKQLADLAGRPLLEHVLENAARAELDRLVVVLGADAEEIVATIDLHGAEPVICESWREGLAEPLKRGVEALSGLEAVVVMLGDQPFVSAAAIRRVVASRRADRTAVRATYGGQPGHPVLFEAGLFTAIASLRGDAGARGLLAATLDAVVDVACEDIADPLDVDDPEDLRLAEVRLEKHGAEYEARRELDTGKGAPGPWLALDAGTAHEREWVRFWEKLADE